MSQKSLGSQEQTQTSANLSIFSSIGNDPKVGLAAFPLFVRVSAAVRDIQDEKFVLLKKPEEIVSMERSPGPQLGPQHDLDSQGVTLKERRASDVSKLGAEIRKKTAAGRSTSVHNQLMCKIILCGGRSCCVPSLSCVIVTAVPCVFLK